MWFRLCPLAWRIPVVQSIAGHPTFSLSLCWRSDCFLYHVTAPLSESRVHIWRHLLLVWLHGAAFTIAAREWTHSWMYWTHWLTAREAVQCAAVSSPATDIKDYNLSLSPWDSRMPGGRPPSAISDRIDHRINFVAASYTSVDGARCKWCNMYTHARTHTHSLTTTLSVLSSSAECDRYSSCRRLILGSPTPHAVHRATRPHTTRSPCSS